MQYALLIYNLTTTSRTRPSARLTPASRPSWPAGT